MNKIFFVFFSSAFVLMNIGEVKAQKEGQFLADSLEQVLSKEDLPETNRVDVLTKLSFEYRNLLPRKAVIYGEQAEKLAKEIPYENKLGEIYFNIALAYNFYNDNIKSYEYALEALKYNTIYHVHDLIPLSKLIILNTNPNTTNESIIDSLEHILLEINNIKNKIWYIKTIGSIGNMYSGVGKFKKADSLITLAIEESIKNNQKFLEVHNLSREAILNFQQHKFDTALYLAKKINIYLCYIKEKRIYTENLNLISECYWNKFKTEAKIIYLDSAQKYADLGSQIAFEIEYKTEILYHYFNLYEINKAKGNSIKAMSYLDKFVLLNDSLFGQNARSKLEGIAISQRDDIAKEQLKVKDAEVERQRVYSYAGLIGIVLIAITLFFVYRNYYNQKKLNKIITVEKQRSEDLLLNILPIEVAEELKATGAAKAKAFTMVTVMFTDFKDFTNVSEKVSAELLVDEIHHCFSAFDNIIQKHQIEKIKTIGDAYLCASGLPVSNYTHAVDMLNASFEIRDFMLHRKQEKEAKGEIPFELRIGIHTGPVVAGIVGVKKYAYDIWGDTVNLAARMEQNCDAGKINISGSTYELVKDKFKCEHRGKIEAKNKGLIDMFFVERVAFA